MVIIDEHDLGKTKIQILMDLIYESTNTRIPEQWIQYGKPHKLDARPDDPYDPNTFIPVKIDHRYNDVLSKNAGFMYRRHSLQTHLAGVVWEFPSFPTTLRHLVAQVVNPQLGYPLDVNDIKDYVIDDPQTNQVVISAVDDSFLWMSGANGFAIAPPGDEFFILVEDPLLTGFNPYSEP